MAKPEIEDPIQWLLREDVGGAYDAVARSAARAVGAARCELALYDGETDEVVARRPRYEAPGQAVPEFRFRLEDSRTSERVVRTGEVYVSNDPAADKPIVPGESGQRPRSIATVPLHFGGRVVGLLYALDKPGGFSDPDVATLTALAGGLAATLENVRLFSLERERRVLGESLSSLSRAVVESGSEGAALETVLDHMARAVRFHTALAAVRSGSETQLIACCGDAAGNRGDGALLEPLFDATSVRELTPLERAPLVERGLAGTEGRTVGTSLRSRGGLLGAIAIDFAPEHPVSTRQLRVVQAFAEHAALFLGAAAAARREREGREREATLVRIARVAATRLEAEPFLRAAAPEILAATGADRAALYLKHPEEPRLYPAALGGATAGELVPFWERRLELDGTPLAALVAPGRPLFFDAADPPPGALFPFRDPAAVAAVPLLFRDDVVGALIVAWLGRERRLDTELVWFLRSLAQHVALGVGNARLVETLTELATVDELTGLPNRRRLRDTLRQELARARRDQRPLTLVLGDIDHLKRVNDAHGHPAGDAAIRHVADAFRRGRREIDVPARLSGEEFALLLPGADRAGGVIAAERIVADLSASELPQIGRITASLGLATFPDDAREEDELIRVADERLYAAKAAGRNRVWYGDTAGYS